MPNKRPFNRIRFADAQVMVERRADGSLILRSPHSLGKCPPHIGEYLRRWAVDTPNATFLAERSGSDWRRLSYAEALTMIECLGKALLDRNLSPDRPLMVLSENSIDLGLLTLAGMYVGVPVAPVSPAYSLQSNDFQKLKAIVKLVQPGLVYARSGDAYARALEAIASPSCEIVVSVGYGPGRTHSRFSSLLESIPDRSVERARSSIRPDHVAKILFTSGSTGDPKGVITTQRMICANAQSVSVCWPFLEDKPPVIVDWLPWSHAFAANHNFNLILRNGGSLYIDDGKPMPGLIERTVENLRMVSPTLWLNSPRGFDMVLPFLERDKELADNLFKELDLIMYAGASLPQNVWERLEAAAVKSRGERVRIVSSWGATETTSTATSVYFTIERSGVVGIPAPGVEIKLSPIADKMELRVRGPVVTPGYWKRPDLTLTAFDDEGFYKIGDAGKLADPCDASKGIVFDGRVAEDFKLSSGTWVHCGQVRLGTINSCSPLVQDVVVLGSDREDLGLLLFLNLLTCRAFLGDDNLTLTDAANHPRVQTHLRNGLARYNLANDANSTRITRAAIIPDAPSIDHGEITDKGYINQRAVGQRRTGLVERLYAMTANTLTFLTDPRSTESHL
jgi:feruloyl-CoA synthase